jgi:hypothetical protein
MAARYPAALSVTAEDDRHMIDHPGIHRTDRQQAAGFHDRVLGVLGRRRVVDFDEAAATADVRRRPGDRPG